MNVAIIGAGSAGLMCACALSKKHSVTVLEKNSDAGKKLMLTGKGRCNLTNLVKPCEFLQSVLQNSEFVKDSLLEFTPKDTVSFFEGIGVRVQAENNNRVFPSRDGASAVRYALQKHAELSGVKFIFNTTVARINKKNCFKVVTFCLENKQESVLDFDIVIVATGGMSFPATGSTGDGYAIAKKFGHNIISPRAALCGMRLETQIGLPGSSVNCSALIIDEKSIPVTETETGDMLFTKNGVSGPIVFRLTSMFKNSLIDKHFLQVNFAPNLVEEKLQARLIKMLKESSRKSLFYVFREFVPIAVANWLVEASKLPKSKPCANFTKLEIEKIFLMITQSRIPIIDFEDIKTATITRGGIDVNKVDSNSMQSKLVSGLFFIGEVLDVDALSGGFNLQIAFSTANSCAKALNQY